MGQLAAGKRLAGSGLRSLDPGAQRVSDHRPLAGRAVADLSLAHDRLPGIPGISMGQLAAGNRLAGSVLRSIDPGAQRFADHGPFAGRAVAAALALVPTDVSIRLRQITQRRSVVAKS